ncbi:MAG: hypothetical protein ABRQ39_00395 [Candidatus Eremiobacterota bacterium]
MKKDEKIQEFSLSGGPLYRLGCRLGLVRGGTNTLWMGIAISLLFWGILVLLSLPEGKLHRIFSLEAIGGNIRLMVVIPLFFLCETIVVPRMAEFVQNIVSSGLVRESSLPSLEAGICRVRRMKDSWLAEVIFLVAAFIFPLLDSIIDMPGRTAHWEAILSSSGGGLGLHVIWYMMFCLPLFRFLLLRWLWNLGLWFYFLWLVEKLDLNLIPTHPDGAAGLGYLEVVQENFASLALAISTLCSGNFAEEISAGTMTFETVYPFMPVVMIVFAVIFIGPLLIFSRKLLISRRTGLKEYMVMASRYVNGFDLKWIRGENTSGEPLIGTADIQSLADLNNSMSVVREMRVVPFSQRLITILAVSVILPLIPLLLFKYPVNELVLKLFRILSGM